MSVIDHVHNWEVFSTYLGLTDDGLPASHLLLRCDCGDVGHVADPTPEEWSDAFHAPSQPYEWAGGDNRVAVVEGHTTAWDAEKKNWRVVRG